MLKYLSQARTYFTAPGLGPFLVRSVTGNGAVQMAGMAATFLVGVQLARGLGVREFGFYGIAMAVITLATIPGTLGLPKLVTREVATAQSRNEPASIFGVLYWADRVSLRISGMLTTLTLVAALILLEAEKPLGAALLFGAPMIALLPLANIRGGALSGLHRIVLSQVAIQLLRPVGMSILLFIAFAGGLGRTAALGLAIGSVTAGGALLLNQLWLRRRLPERREKQRAISGRGWLSSSIPLALTDATVALQQQLSILLLGFIASPADVGLFRVALSTSIILGLPAAIVYQVMLPVLARLHAEGDRQRMQMSLSAASTVQFACTFLLALPLLVAPAFFVGLAFGAEYVAAAQTLQILASGQVILAAGGIGAALLNMTGHERRVTRGASVALLMTLLLIALFVPAQGSVGAAIALATGQFCWMLMLWRDSKRFLGMSVAPIPWTVRRRRNVS